MPSIRQVIEGISPERVVSRFWVDSAPPKYPGTTRAHRLPIRFTSSDALRQIATLYTNGDEIAQVGAEAGLRKALSFVRANIRARGLVDTGHLMKNWTIEHNKTSMGKGSSRLVTDTVYARIHEFGGIIRPVRAKMLSWVDKQTGERIFAHQVRIPARPYFRPAFDEHSLAIRNASTRAVDEAISMLVAKDKGLRYALEVQAREAFVLESSSGHVSQVWQAFRGGFNPLKSAVSKASGWSGFRMPSSLRGKF